MGAIPRRGECGIAYLPGESGVGHNGRVSDHPPVLVIDNDDDGAEAIVELLRLEGFLPVRAHTGRQALDYLARGLKPCAILLDLLMPGDGWHFRAEQAANPEWAKIPVIVSTALGKRPDAIAREVDIPEDHYLLKPFDFDRLLALVSRYCPAQAA
jgi:CheY-like chemotaxis protein